MKETKEKFTPGPWQLDGTIVRPPSDAPRKAAVAACGLSHGLGEAGQADRANAALISAAPDYHFWVQRLIAELPQNRDWLDPEIERGLKSAIAKATGQSPKTKER